MLDFTLDPAGSEPIFMQIAACVRSAIIAGQIAPGTRLPSARALAARLAVARGTVDAAYALLAGEGAVLTRGSVGTIVSGAAGTRIEAVSHTPFMFTATAPSDRTAPQPLRIGLPALDAFPRRLWSNLTAQAARAMPAADLAEAEAAGVPDLRQAVATHLGAARGISCSAQQVLITAGYQGALTLVRHVLLRPGDPVWIEDPGYLLARQALETGGARVIPVRVDHDGLRVASGVAAAPRAKLAVVTPAHQYPTGAALSLPRRLELLAWAAEAGSWILEDDYDSELRYTGRPLPSLKSLDRGERVLYAGSFSKTLFPALRLGYLVVPAELAAAFLRAARLTALAQPVLAQSVAAAFMGKGHFIRHIRRMRSLYADRRRALGSALRVAFGERIVLQPAAGGMHLLARFPSAADDTELVRRCAAAGLAPSALSPLAMAHDCGHGLLLGFTNVAAEDAAAVAARLAGAVS
jgi:GntR family transcriptional regulator / MocR family aminotransferase